MFNQLLRIKLMFVYIAIRKQGKVGQLDIFETEDQAYDWIGESSYSFVGYSHISKLKEAVDLYTQKHTKLTINPMFKGVDYLNSKWIYTSGALISGKGKTLEDAKLDAECNYERAKDEVQSW